MVEAEGVIYKRKEKEIFVNTNSMQKTPPCTDTIHETNKEESKYNPSPKTKNSSTVGMNCRHPFINSITDIPLPKH